MIVQTVTLPVGARVADFLGEPHTPQWFVAHGFAGIASYVKATTPDQIAAWHRAGLAWIPIHENSRTESLGGAPAAQKYGPRTRAKLDAWGHPTDALVSVVAQDEGPGFGPASYPTVRAYFETIGPLLGRPMADYGGTTLGHHACSGITQGTWRAAARSWSAEHPERALAQQSLQTNGYDPNVVLQPIVAWLPHEVPDPAPVPPSLLPTTRIPAALAALTEDTTMSLRFVGARTPAPGVDPRTRWITNGMVRSTPTADSAAYAIIHGLVENTLETADMLTDAELAGLPLIGA